MSLSESKDFFVDSVGEKEEDRIIQQEVIIVAVAKNTFLYLVLVPYSIERSSILIRKKLWTCFPKFGRITLCSLILTSHEDRLRIPQQNERKTRSHHEDRGPEGSSTKRFTGSHSV